MRLRHVLGSMETEGSFESALGAPLATTAPKDVFERGSLPSLGGCSIRVSRVVQTLAEINNIAFKVIGIEVAASVLAVHKKQKSGRAPLHKTPQISLVRCLY